MEFSLRRLRMNKDDIFKQYLFNHEEDIASNFEDFGNLKEIFKEIFGREASDKPKVLLTTPFYTSLDGEKKEMSESEGELKSKIGFLRLDNDQTNEVLEVLDEAKKELLTFKEFIDAGMMATQKDDFSDIYSVYISRKIEKWFGNKK
jgi:hypothetical protein